MFKTFNICLLIIIILSSFNGFAQQLPTRAEIYDFDIGDEFHVEYQYKNNGSEYFYEVKRSKVISKTINSGNQSVEYHFEVGYYSKVSALQPGFPKDTSYTFIDTVIYSKLNDTISHHLDSNLCAHTNGDSLYTNPLLNNRLTYNVFCLAMEYGADFYYHKGLGGWYGWFTQGFTTEEYRNLLFYKKGSETWGEPSYVGLNKLKRYEEEFNIYPMPNKGNFKIEFQQIESGELRVLNSTGQLMYKEVFSSKKNLDVALSKSLPSGIYIVRIATQQTVNQKRLIIE